MLRDIHYWSHSLPRTALRLCEFFIRSRRGVKTFAQVETVHWLPRIQAMLERGASVRAAAKEIGRSHVTVLRALVAKWCS